ncbi:MAG: hypothetical protein KAV82_09340 [Phycisphaerae bacterium]|nr:hypothetical protein [Phycisphaerae bacterium]
MNRRPQRVVRQVQLLLHGEQSVVDMEASLASQISELERRIARIRRLGTQYAGVRVSQDVQNLRQAAVAEGCGGHRVTMEV